jgi:hypothetical protein
MDKAAALATIDELVRKLIHPVELLRLVTLRVIILQIPEEEWNRYLDKAQLILSQ